LGNFSKVAFLAICKIFCSLRGHGPRALAVNTPTGASTPYKRWSKCSLKKVRGEGFCSLFGKLRGEAKISLLIVALTASANHHLIYCKWLT